MPLPGAAERIDRAVTSWPDVQVSTEDPFVRRVYRVGDQEFGTVHGDWIVDVFLSEPARDEVVAAGLAEPHHVFPTSGRVTRFLRTPDDVQEAIDLLRRAHEIAKARREGPEHELTQEPVVPFDPVDEALRETFPASDPPFWMP